MPRPAASSWIDAYRDHVSAVTTRRLGGVALALVLAACDSTPKSPSVEAVRPDTAIARPTQASLDSATAAILADTVSGKAHSEAFPVIEGDAAGDEDFMDPGPDSVVTPPPPKVPTKPAARRPRS